MIFFLISLKLRTFVRSSSEKLVHVCAAGWAGGTGMVKARKLSLHQLSLRSWQGRECSTHNLGRGHLCLPGAIAK